MISAPVLFGQARASLDSGTLEIVRRELEQRVAEFRVTDSSNTFPMACRLYWGSKQGRWESRPIVRDKSL